MVGASAGDMYLFIPRLTRTGQAARAAQRHLDALRRQPGHGHVARAADLQMERRRAERWNLSVARARDADSCEVFDGQDIANWLLGTEMRARLGAQLQPAANDF